MINYRAKLWFGQRVTATVRIHTLGRTSMTLAFEVHGHAQGTCEGGIAAYGTTAHVPAGASSAQPWPAHIREAAGPVTDDTY